MLEMLKGMYEDQKRRIADLNQREEKNKKTFEKQKAEHDERMKRIEDLHAQHKVSEEFTRNSTHKREQDVLLLGEGARAQPITCTTCS